MTGLIERENTRSTAVTEVNQPMRLLELAISNNADVDKLEKLMALQERWNAQEAKKSFLRAMATFQESCPDIIKAKKGHNCLYAPLSDIVTQVRGLLADNGLSYRFEQTHESQIEVTCIVSHVDGHSEKTTMKADPDTSGAKNAIQAVGSAVQYLMRYTFIGALGITTADIDMDGRVPQKPNADAITQDSEAWLTDYRNSLEVDAQAKFDIWLKVPISQLTEIGAKNAIKAIQANSKKVQK